LDTIKSLQRGKVARIIKDLYGNVPGFNWRIMDTPVLVTGYSDANAFTIPTMSAIETYLVGPRLNNASNLFYASTILHEAAHAFLFDYYYKKTNMPAALRDSMLQSSYSKQLQKFLELEESGNNVAQHELLLNFQNDIYIALLEYCQKTGITGSSVASVCYDLSWSGLQETNYFLALPEADRADIQAQWEAERLGNYYDQYSGQIYNAIGVKACP
jgi:hypothetical protein